MERVVQRNTPSLGLRNSLVLGEKGEISSCLEIRMEHVLVR